MNRSIAVSNVNLEARYHQHSGYCVRSVVYLLGKIVDIAAENIELAAAVAEVSNCISLAKKCFYLEDLA